MTLEEARAEIKRLNDIISRNKEGYEELREAARTYKKDMEFYKRAYENTQAKLKKEQAGNLFNPDNPLGKIFGGGR
jgi:chromosome segregation ATPase